MNEREAPAVAANVERPTAPHPAVSPLGWEGIAAIAILVVAAAPVRDWVSADSIIPVVIRVLWWVVYVTAVARLFQAFGTNWLLWLIREQPALCALLGVTLASCLWSLAPALTLQKAVSLFGTTATAIWIGLCGPPGRLMRILYWTFTIVIVSSVVVAATLPLPVIDAPPYWWRGIMAHRNSLGAAAALATACFLVLTMRRQIHPVWGAPLCALSLLALAQTRSRTPFVALSACLLVWVVVAIAALTGRSVRRLVRTVSIVLVLGVAVGPLLAIGLAVPPGTPDTLNGRPYIWKGASAMVGRRPLTGYGYAVVWGRGDATLLPEFEVTRRRFAVNAHNSIVNIATEIGIPAALIACVYLVGALTDAGRLCERAPSAFSLTALLLLIGITVMGFAETHLLHIHWVFWMLMVAITVAVRGELQGGAAARCAEAA